MSYATAWLVQGSAQVPDKMVGAAPGYTYHAVRGYSSLVAAKDGSGTWVGFVDVRELGFETARAWMKGQST